MHYDELQYYMSVSSLHDWQGAPSQESFYEQVQFTCRIVQDLYSQGWVCWAGETAEITKGLMCPSLSAPATTHVHVSDGNAVSKFFPVSVSEEPSELCFPQEDLFSEASLLRSLFAVCPEIERPCVLPALGALPRSEPWTFPCHQVKPAITGPCAWKECHIDLRVNRSSESNDLVLILLPP